MRFTGLSDDLLAGQRFDDEALATHLGDVDAIVAFNAPFDAGYWRRRFGGLRFPWICAQRDYNWSAAGYAERNQAGLVAAMGHFYPPHRAAPDAWALATLIAAPAEDGRTIAAHMIVRAKRHDYRISAVQAPFAVKEVLKQRGYRWHPARRVWTIDVSGEQSEAECRALRDLSSVIIPRLETVDWFNRHIREEL